jgi:hypothetical protein
LERGTCGFSPPCMMMYKVYDKVLWRKKQV